MEQEMEEAQETRPYEKKTVEERQSEFFRKFRKRNYVLSETLQNLRIAESTFRIWMVEDPGFQALFQEMEKEQEVYLMQTAREIASGNHPSTDGVPDKAMLKWILGMYDKRTKKPLGQKEQEMLEELGDLDEEELALLEGDG